MQYAGGKNGAGVYQSIINLMPPHRVYIEPFLGSGAVLRMKRPAKVNIGVDLDARAVEALRLQLASPELASGAMANLQESSPETSSLQKLLASTKLTVGSGVEFLRAYPFRGDELVYCDPPYPLSVRRSKRAIYAHEFGTEEEHAELLRLIVALPCMVMISGYRSDLYDRALAKWRRAEFHTTNRAGQRTLECVWMNFAEPLELHDYRYLGRGFRERERIKRRRERFKAKLLRMPELERHAILSAVAELRAGHPRQI
jgi:DNA adenine methylase